MGETILEEAQRLVHGPRQASYGHPFDDLGRTGKMWAAILGVPEVAPEQVALCMIAVKIGREVSSHTRDNLTDTCGYAETIMLIREERENRRQLRKELAQAAAQSDVVMPGD